MKINIHSYKKNIFLKLYLGILFLFFFSLPFNIGTSNVTLTMFVLYSTFYSIRFGFKKKPNRIFLISTILFVSFFFLFVYSTLSNSIEKIDLSIIEHRLSFLFIPILLTLNYFILSKKIVFINALKGFLAGNLIAGVINIGLALKNSIRYNNKELFFDSSVWGNNTPFWFSIDHIGNYFFSIHFSNFIHPSYWAMYLIFAIGIIWFLIETKQAHNKYGYLTLASFFIFLIFLLSSRAGYAILIVVLGLIIYKSFFLIRKPTSISYAFIGIFILIFISFIFNPRAYSLIENFGKVSDGSSNQRLNSWYASIQIIKKQPLTGVGVNNSELHLMKMYKKLDYLENYQEHHNSHNQYLEVQLGLGITGSLILLAIIWVGIIASIKFNNFLFALFLIITSMSFLFESVLNRYHGIIFYTFFYLILASQCVNTTKSGSHKSRIKQ